MQRDISSDERDSASNSASHSHSHSYSASDSYSYNDSNSDSDGDHDEHPRLSLYELDLDNGWAVELSRAPIELLNNFGCVQHAVCDGDCIYIGNTYPSMLFNVKTQEWVGEKA